MHTSTQLAVSTAQVRRRQTTSGYQQDLYDLALDELLRQPDRDGDPEQLLANALANARKHLRRRRAIAAITPYGDPVDLAVIADAAAMEQAMALIDALGWLSRAPLTNGERQALTAEAWGFDTAATATVPGASVTASRQRLARARASARTARVGNAW